MKKIHSICPPFLYLTMPSYDIASIKALLKQYGVDMTVDLMYLDYAVYIGGSIYNILHNSNGGDMIFSALLFPDNKERLKTMWNEQTGMSYEKFDVAIKKTKIFCSEYIKRVRNVLENKKIVHFHLYTKSMFSSIYIAKLIFEQFKSEIWFSGYHCQGNCGKSLKKIFPFINSIIENDVEASVLYKLTGVSISDNTINYLPTPDYSDFNQAYNDLPEYFKNEYLSRYWFQIEFNRGCWWNKCTFCTLNCQYTSFQEKSVKNIIADYKSIIKNQNTMQIIVYERNSGDEWRQIIECLDAEFPGMQGTYSLSFKVSCLMSPDDIKFLKEHKVNFLVGTESFSSKCLQLINKGQRIIDNILMLKYCERYEARCYHNFMYAFPFETEKDYIEAEKNIKLIYHLQPPFDLEEFRLTYGSEIYNYPNRFGIKKINMRSKSEEVLFPQKYHQDYVPFFYDFDSSNPGIELRKKRWINLINQWREIYYQDALDGIPKRGSLLSMRTYEDQAEIYDLRYSNLSQIYKYSEVSKDIYLYCDAIRSEKEILKAFDGISEQCIKDYLNEFVRKKLMFKEGTDYLSLAI